MLLGKRLAASLCCLLLLFWGFPLLASDIDLGLGIGFFHTTMHSPDPLPSQFGGELFFRDFGTPMPELGIPISEKLKLSLRAKYLHREYQVRKAGYQSDLVIQHMGQYLDFPLSLNARIQNFELFAGANISYLLYDFVFDDITQTPEEYKDAKTFVPGVHAGFRIPLPHSQRMSVLAFYAKDLIPFSELWERRMYQDRYVVQLMYRIIRENHTSALDSEIDWDKIIKEYLPGLDMGVGFGFSRAKLFAAPNHALVEDYEYRKSHYYSDLQLGYQVLPQLQLASFPHLNWREYKVTEKPYGRDFFTAQSQYLELPLLLKSNLAGMELLLGANLAFETRSKYNSSVEHSPESEYKDANPFIPGLSVGVGFPLGQDRKTALNLLYTKDGEPYSKAWGFSKSQGKLAFYLSYDLIQPAIQQDLLPRDCLGKDGLETSLEAGYQRVTLAQYKRPQIFFRYGRQKRGISGFGQGYLFGLGFTSLDYYDNEISIGRITVQKRLSFAKSRFELYTAPGVGLDTGAGVRRQHYYMDEGFPIMGYANLMFAWEAGLRLNVYKGFSLIGFCAKQNTPFFNTPLQGGGSLEYRSKGLFY